MIAPALLTAALVGPAAATLPAVAATPAPTVTTAARVSTSTLTQLQLLQRRKLQQRTRIISIASHLVGRVRYVWGGSTPRQGLDCSGLTRWAYLKAGVAVLPHNAEMQRRMHRMRHISPGQARPGDLIFYLGRGGAYHVTIYAGHGMEYSASSPRLGLQYRPIMHYSRHVYGSLIN